MSRQYVKMEALSEEVFRRKANGESYGLSLEQIRNLVKRQNRKGRQIANGYIPRPKGRPRKDPPDEEVRRQNELIELRIQVELLRNFLYEAGKR